MRRTWVWILAAVGAASLVVLGTSLVLPGLEELSWAAGTGSFVLAAAALALAWPRRTPPSPEPAPPPVAASTRVDNHTGDIHGTALQARDIHGPVTVNSPPAPAAPPVPGWVNTALPVGQADAHELGAHDALPGPTGEGLPPYVARDVDDELDHRLAAAADAPRGGLVLVTGASTAGKTRALAQALARTLPERMLVAPPEDADLRPLPAWLKQSAACAPQGWVVWLDDVDRHLSASGLTPALVAELSQAGAVVAATIRRERLDSLRPSTTDLALGAERVGYVVLKTPPVTVRRDWSGHERERARTSGDERLVRAAADERFGVAEQLAAGPHLQQAWESGPDSGHPRGYALVAAAVGLAQAGLASPLTREQLHSAHSIYLRDPPPLPENADWAWEWATQPRSGLAGLLVPTDHEGRRWRAFDYLTTQDPLPDAVWHAALDAATDQDRFTIGVTAQRAEQTDIAETAWCPLAEQGNTDAMLYLGNLLANVGRVEEAEEWYRKAAEQGLTHATVSLGFMLERVGRMGEAEDWYRQAIEQGHTIAMVRLGHVLSEADRQEEAEDWYRKAAEQGHTSGMLYFGSLLADVGRVEEAEEWYRKAAQQDDTQAMLYLGSLLADVGRVEEAEEWYRKAAQQDDTQAMLGLGLLLSKADRQEEAEEWSRKAAEQGHTGAMLNLGYLLLRKGRTEEAEGWYQKAIDQGNTYAMLNLGNLLLRKGRTEEAEGWYQKAIDQGNTYAMLNLGNLLLRKGRTEEAEGWYQKAIDQGNTYAMLNLGNLLLRKGRTEEAEGWYQKAIDQGNTYAMVLLGELLRNAGRVEEAETWRQRAREVEGAE
ncbi:tetratricopeptide repeat protein [Nocardiopsis dassonvillei]|uniref:SEL1-like repeat protein n=1 Tax=Nocardiopsis dassonvillei TaxID=2014 RepID=UPI003F58012C